MNILLLFLFLLYHSCHSINSSELNLIYDIVNLGEKKIITNRQMHISTFPFNQFFQESQTVLEEIQINLDNAVYSFNVRP